MKRFALAVLMLLLATGAASAQKVTWKLGNPWPAKHPATEDIEALLADVRQRTGGQLDIELVFLDALGFKQADLLRVLRQNVVQSVLFVPYYVGRDAPKLANVVPVGGLLEPEDNLKVAPAQRAYAERLLRRDWNAVMPVPFFNRGGRMLLLIGRDPVAGVAALKGKKVRHFDRIGIKALQDLGIAAQNIPQAELYLALQTGVVDAALHGLSNVRAQSLNEVTCCFSEFTPFPGQGAPYGFAILTGVWDKVPEPLKQAFAAAGEKSWQAGLADWRGDADEKDKAWLRAKGMRELPALALEERRQLQDTVFAAWKLESEKLGAEAVELYQTVSAALGR